MTDNNDTKDEKGTEVVEMETSGTQAVVLPADPNAAMMQMIERVAMDPNADVGKMEKLLDMKLKVMGIEAEQDFNVAMTAAQAEMRPISADATNPQTHSKYASYAQLDKALRPIYTRNGFACSFNGGDGAPEGMVRIYLYVSHTSGHTRIYQTDMPADGKGAKGGDVMTKTHAHGAGFSYGQRYLLKLAFNVAIGEDDNDGNQTKGPIEKADAVKLEALADEVGADKKKFCEYFRVGSIPEISTGQYYNALQMLNKKAAQK